jgi:hypothetical protein
MELITILLFLIALPIIIELLFWAICIVIGIICAPFYIIGAAYEHVAGWFKKKTVD